MLPAGWDPPIPTAPLAFPRLNPAFSNDASVCLGCFGSGVSSVEGGCADMVLRLLRSGGSGKLDGGIAVFSAGIDDVGS